MGVGRKRGARARGGEASEGTRAAARTRIRPPARIRPGLSPLPCACRVQLAPAGGSVPTRRGGLSPPGSSYLFELPVQVSESPAAAEPYPSSEARAPPAGVATVTVAAV